MIRILILGMHDKIGGVETFLMNYYRNLDRSKIQFDFISIYDELCFEDEILKLGGKIYKIPSEKKHPLKYCKELEKVMNTNKYRIIHINMLSAANILPILIAKKQKIKHIIVHSHNSNTPSGGLRKILNIINKPFLKLATDYWACSELAGKWLFGKKILQTNRLTVINNAIDIEKYQYNENTRNEIRKQLQIQDKLVIGNIGRFAYQKNHEFLIDIFYEIQKQNKNTILLLIGEGELKEKIEQKVKMLNIEDKVILLGTTNKVYQYLQAMDVFILPSRFEGLPVTGIEAQASGVECFLSEEITKEVKVNSNLSFISLKEDSIYWANKILKATHERNLDKLNAYDIKINVKKLEKKYEEMGTNRRIIEETSFKG